MPFKGNQVILCAPRNPRIFRRARIHFCAGVGAWPNDNVTDVSGVNVRKRQASRFFCPPVNLVVAPYVLSVLFGTGLVEFPVSWYPPHGDFLKS